MITTADCTYRFEPVPACDMCAAPESAFSVLGRRLNRAQGPWPRKKAGIATTVCRCGQCGLVFANPRPVPATVGAHYDVPPEEYLNYTTLTPAADQFASELAWLERLMPTVPGMRSLDVGAGVGLQMLAMARRGYDAYGLEPSEPFFRHAIEKTGIATTHLTLASVETASYPVDHFDLINFGAVLEHLQQPSISLTRALCWLKPGGLMYAEVPSARWLISRMANLFYRATGTDFVANLSPMHAPFHLYEFTLKAFELHGRAAGYTLADHQHFVCSTYLPGPLGSIASGWMKMTGTGMQLCVWLRKTRSAH